MSNNRSSHARAIIELLCRILEQNEISSVRAETLRQAKFDKDAAARQMAQLLFSVIRLCDNHSKTGSVEPTELVMSEEQKMVYIKTKLQGWGYLSHSFAKLPHDLSTGSRELLLALGWVIHQKKFLDKIIHRRSSPLHRGLVGFSKPQEASESTDEPKTFPSHEENLCLQERIHYHMVLTGKLRMSLRRLHSTYQQLASLTHTIHRSTEGVYLQPRLSHLTPLEVHVLRFPSSLKRMVQDLEKDNEELTNLLEWKQKESIFWEWMGSVLIAHQEGASRCSSAASLRLDTPIEQTVYLPVPADIGEQVVLARDQLRDVILGHEQDMSKVEQILSKKKISQVEAEVHKMHLDKALFEVTLRLRSCGLGEETDPPGKSPTQDTAAEADELFPGAKKMQPHRPFEFLGYKSEIPVPSPYEIQAARRAALLEAVNKEISELKEKVETLETDLRQAQLENMQRVQSIINMDENVICIQPRSLKQYYDN